MRIIIILVSLTAYNSQPEVFERTYEDEMTNYFCDIYDLHLGIIRAERQYQADRQI